MPWKEVKPMEQKILFIADYLRGGRSFMELCRSYGISRKIGYKWVGRYRDGGMEVLHERSRKPHLSPTKHPLQHLQRDYSDTNEAPDTARAEEDPGSFVRAASRVDSSIEDDHL